MECVSLSYINPANFFSVKQFFFLLKLELLPKFSFYSFIVNIFKCFPIFGIYILMLCTRNI